MKKILLLLVILISSSTALFAQKFSISAKLMGFKDGTKFYLEDPEIQKNIDSAVIKHNFFSMEGKLNDFPKTLWLTTTTEGKSYWCTIFIGNDNVEINGNRSDFPFNLHVSGSKYQDTYNKLNRKIRDLMTKRNKLAEDLGTLLTDESDSSKAKVDDIGVELDQIDHITDSINSSVKN